MTDFGSDLHLAKLLPEFSRLQAILGRRIKETDQWAPYARLVALHGWKRLLRAAEQADPDKRWAPDLERLCNQYAKEAADEERAAQERERIAALPKPKNPQESAALFAQIRERHGV